DSAHAAAMAANTIARSTAASRRVGIMVDSISASSSMGSREAAFDVGVIGAGAAGMMGAATAGQRGRRVVLIDHYPKVGEKIRISGGGRCNFTNLHATHADYLSADPAFCHPALERYTPRDFIALVES